MAQVNNGECVHLGVLMVYVSSQGLTFNTGDLVNNTSQYYGNSGNPS